MTLFGVFLTPVFYLTQFTRNAQQSERLDAAARDAEDAARLAALRFDAGAVDFLVALDAQRQALTTQDTLVQARLGQATALVAVYRALGGGWPQDLTSVAGRWMQGKRTAAPCLASSRANVIGYELGRTAPHKTLGMRLRRPSRARYTQRSPVIGE